MAHKACAKRTLVFTSPPLSFLPSFPFFCPHPLSTVLLPTCPLSPTPSNRLLLLLLPRLLLVQAAFSALRLPQRYISHPFWLKCQPRHPATLSSHSLSIFIFPIISLSKIISVIGKLHEAGTVSPVTETVAGTSQMSSDYWLN